MCRRRSIPRPVSGAIRAALLLREGRCEESLAAAQACALLAPIRGLDPEIGGDERLLQLLVGDDHIAARGAAPGGGPVGLGLHGHLALMEHGGFGQHDGGRDHALAAGTGKHHPALSLP